MQETKWTIKKRGEQEVEEKEVYPIPQSPGHDLTHSQLSSYRRGMGLGGIETPIPQSPAALRPPLEPRAMLPSNRNQMEWGGFTSASIGCSGSPAWKINSWKFRERNLPSRSRPDSSSIPLHTHSLHKNAPNFS